MQETHFQHIEIVVVKTNTHFILQCFYLKLVSRYVLLYLTSQEDI